MHQKFCYHLLPLLSAGITIPRCTANAFHAAETQAAHVSMLPPSSHLLHSPDLRLIHVLFQAPVQVLPPFKHHGLADQLEPWSELELVVLEHLLQLSLGDVLRSLHFVWIDFQVDVGLDEENVIDFVLTPLPVARRFVVYTGQELELLERDLGRLDAELLL